MPSSEVLFRQGLALAAVLAGGLLCWRLAVVSRRRRARAERRASWGQPVDRPRELDLLVADRERSLDPQHDLTPGTWSDLELGRLLVALDRTQTTAGAAGLTRLLGAPLVEPHDLEQRERQLRWLEDAADDRDGLRHALGQLGHSRSPAGLLKWVRDPLPPSGPSARYAALSALAVMALVVALFVGGAAWMLVVGCFFLNMSAHYAARRGIEPHLASLRELGQLVDCGRRLARLPLGELAPLAEPLEAAARELDPVRRACRLLSVGRGLGQDLVQGVVDYVFIYFLVDTHAYFRVLWLLGGRRHALRGLFESVGRLDALQSCASYRAGLESRCAPEFVEGPPSLQIEAGVHPLLDEAVPNSLRLDEPGCVITGSNMAGKSTFLRTVGVNAVLAQTLLACCARSYRATPFQVVSSINPKDDLQRGASSFFAEAERLLAMVRSAGGPGTTLCLVDELFRGTNSAERLAAGEELLGHLAARRTLVLVATHDMELVERLTGRMQGFHFSEAPDEDELRFDYRLRPGNPVTRNAIRLLGQMGFPAELVEGARRRVALAERARAGDGVAGAEHDESPGAPGV